MKCRQYSGRTTHSMHTFVKYSIQLWSSLGTTQSGMIPLANTRTTFTLEYSGLNDNKYFQCQMRSNLKNIFIPWYYGALDALTILKFWKFWNHDQILGDTHISITHGYKCEGYRFHLNLPSSCHFPIILILMTMPPYAIKPLWSRIIMTAE